MRDTNTEPIEPFPPYTHYVQSRLTSACCSTIWEGSRARGATLMDNRALTPIWVDVRRVNSAWLHRNVPRWYTPIALAPKVWVQNVASVAVLLQLGSDEMNRAHHRIASAKQHPITTGTISATE